MSERHLEALQLPLERVERTRQFLTSYAELCMDEFGEMRGRPKGSPHSLIDGAPVPIGWSRLAEAATSYFEAGQWAMLVDPPQALELWRRAGEVYRDLEFGFGYYLYVTVDGAREFLSDSDAQDARIADQMWDRLSAVMMASHTVDEELGRFEPVPLPEPLRHAQQQTYLVLAGASALGVSAKLKASQGVSRSILRAMVVRSPHYEGVTPVGALGIPIRTLWRMAAALVQPNDESASQVADIIGGLARRYDDTIQQAMANEYLWRNTSAPVDVGSFDIASVAMNAYRVFGPERFRGALERVVDDLPSTGRDQIDMSLDLARAADEERWHQ